MKTHTPLTPVDLDALRSMVDSDNVWAVPSGVLVDLIERLLDHAERTCSADEPCDWRVSTAPFDIIGSMRRLNAGAMYCPGCGGRVPTGRKDESHRDPVAVGGVG